MSILWQPKYIRRVRERPDKHKEIKVKHFFNRVGKMEDQGRSG